MKKKAVVNNNSKDMTPVKKDGSSEGDSNVGSKVSSSYGPFLGQLIGTMKSCCRQTYLNGQPRLYEGLYLCLFQIKLENIGKIHSVINKRRGKIIDEKPNDEGTLCNIGAYIPIAESFGFVQEIRKESSGLANTMLQFHHWEMIEDDPFAKIKTENKSDEYDGTLNVIPNVAKTYINKIRERKGLPIDKKVVVNADKQRNLSKKV